MYQAASKVTPLGTTFSTGLSQNVQVLRLRHEEREGVPICTEHCARLVGRRQGRRLRAVAEFRRL